VVTRRAWSLGSSAAVSGLWSGTIEAAKEPFSFEVPEGFVDITRQSTAPPLSAIDQRFFDAAKVLDFMTVKISEGRVVAACSAQVTDGRAPIKNLAEAVAAAQARDERFAQYKLLKSSTMKIDNVECGRAEGERTTPYGVERAIAFLLPSAKRFATLELSVFEPVLFTELAAVFEKAARRTRGLAPSAPPPDPPQAALAKLGFVLLLASLVGKWLRGPKRSTAWRAKSRGTDEAKTEANSEEPKS
jgi:hypothetical protein